MASNNAAYHHQPQQQFSSVPTANNSTNVAAGSTFYGSGMPAMLPRDESFPSSQFGFEVKPPPVPAVVSSPTTEAAALLAPEQPPSGQDMEARTKQLEKRQEAKQRYKDKKKNRKYACRPVYPLYWCFAVISTTPPTEIIYFTIAFAGLASRSCTSPGRCEQTHETESGADLQRRAAAVAMATISLHSMAMMMSSLQILAFFYPSSD